MNDIEIPLAGQRFSSVWDAIEGSQVGAENMKIRSQVLMTIPEHIRNAGMFSPKTSWAAIQRTDELIADVFQPLPVEADHIRENGIEYRIGQGASDD